LGLDSHEQSFYNLVHRHHKQIARRLSQHRSCEVEGFTKHYRLTRLVWVEHFHNVNDAIACEKKLKGCRRSRKVALIEQTNPSWLDLSDHWEQQPKFYDPPLEDRRNIRDSSLRSE
jgi:putative endonuclease